MSIPTNIDRFLYVLWCNFLRYIKENAGQINDNVTHVEETANLAEG